MSDTDRVPDRVTDRAAIDAIAFEHRYAEALEGAWISVTPDVPPAPVLLWLNDGLAAELGLDAALLSRSEGLAMLSGQRVPAGARPLAQAYAGHQFGGFSPQLGDGRALLLGERIDVHGQRRDLAFKGSGRTPFSRGGDGKAAVGPVLREVIFGEALHALGIPATRVLAAVATGETVRRDRPLPGALLSRVAASHLRVGTFQFFAVRGQTAMLRKLVHHAIERHDPALRGDARPALALLRAVRDRQARLLAQWMGVGFIHGVMNTDNMTISGETIDFGPCAFMEVHDPDAVFSSIDHQGRYAYGRQPEIAPWNLARLAEALLPLIAEELAMPTAAAAIAAGNAEDAAIAAATDIVQGWTAVYAAEWLAVHRAKAGLMPPSVTGAAAEAADAADRVLLQDLEQLLTRHRVDHTLGWRRLSALRRGDAPAWCALFSGPVDPSRLIPGSPAEPEGLPPDVRAWLVRLRVRWADADAGTEATAAAAAAMDRVNPLYIARHHRVEPALDAAVERADLAPLLALLAVLRDPYTERDGLQDWAEPAPPQATAMYRTFCGT